VHVAGTNGKGTVTAFVGSMARAAGQRVGVYTSPHLCRFAERINIGGNPIEDDKLVVYLNQVMDIGPDLTFFEVATVTAFLAFRDAQVELAVIEVGLGGRLDATNVIPPPRVAAITRVSYDHMAELGDSLSKIAIEKVGIIKPGSAVVLGKLHPDARAEAHRRMAEVGAREAPLGSPEPVQGAPLAYPRVALVGSNLAVAVTIGRELGFSPEVLAKGVEQTVWPGRNELLHRNGQELTLLDCAHNPDGAVALSHALDPSVLGDIESRKENRARFRRYRQQELARHAEAAGDGRRPSRVRRAARTPRRRSLRNVSRDRRRSRRRRAGRVGARSAIGRSTRLGRGHGLDLSGRCGAARRC
jgi:dihydrofolate synthase/folylpolyglutamate synthase